MQCRSHQRHEEVFSEVSHAIAYMSLRIYLNLGMSEPLRAEHGVCGEELPLFATAEPPVPEIFVGRGVAVSVY